VNLRLTCSQCSESAYIANVAEAQWSCPACDHRHHLTIPQIATGKPLAQCVSCSNRELYRQKNFPQWLGLTILAAACASFFILQGLYLPKLAWVILLGSAAFDGLLYLFVGDVIVCYRCHARHYGLPRNRAYQPFELPIAEKYRQERIRREMQAAETKNKV